MSQKEEKKEPEDLEKLGRDVWQETELKNLVNKMTNNIVTYSQLIQTNALLMKYKYDLLVKQGFTEEQAMEIITKVPILG